MPNEAEVSINVDERGKLPNVGLLGVLPLFTGDEKRPISQRILPAN